MTDQITVITSRGRRLTKAWNGETCKVEGYQEARQIKVEEREVSDIFSLRSLLEELESRSNSCIIRGKYVGDERSAELMPSIIEQDRRRKPDAKAPDDGYTLRRLVLFPDRKLHYIMLDIDGFVPTGIDPVTEPVAAIDQYIRTKLPTCFHDVTYCWQLSGSAGHESAKGVLKSHVCFWLRTPHTGEALEAWGNSLNAERHEKVVDITVFRPVQANYTAFPVFINGAADPVPVRSGIERSIFSDEVDLIIDPSVIKTARSERKLREDMVDHSEKEGLVGLFHRTYTIEDVVERWLPEVFEFVTEDRLNWLLSDSGAKEGAGVTSNRQGIFNTHNGDPLKGRATNQWDLVRHYKFGHLDDDVDELLRENVNLLPSQDAMIEMVKDLPEIKVQLKEEKLRATTDWKQKIDCAADEYDLQDVIENGVALDRDLSIVEKGKLEAAIKQKFGSLGVNLPVKTIRDMMRPPKKRSEVSIAMEDWCGPYVWCQFEDKFINQDTQESVSVQSFNAKHGRDVKGKWTYGDSEMQMQAAYVALHELQVPIIDRRMYLPWADPFFERNGLEYMNTYRSSTVPEEVMPADWSKQDKKAVEAVKDHLQKLVRGEAETLIKWMAFCAQNPGRKIRWSILIKGTYGDGKSLIGTIMELTMGEANVGRASPKVLNSDFNAWAEGACVCVIEELRLHGHNRHDTSNALKELHTNDIITIHRKGQDPYKVCNTQNYLAFTNFADAVPIDDSDRRWMVIFTPFGDENALIKAGMDAGYFSNLFELIRDHYKALRGWLLTVDLDGFKQDGRAPATMAKEVMAATGRSEEDESVMDIIRRGYVGVSNDVISTSHLSLALAEFHPHIELRGRSFVPVMSRLGFVRRPDPIRWKGQLLRVWLKNLDSLNSNDTVRRLLDDTEDGDPDVTENLI